ncbi:hypothetical protein BDZ97DRAFT_1150156 [Flammula alnicola]|nr:hypothetical protein BDZ97DRAFT_1150156 [Flammula alnicola]
MGFGRGGVWIMGYRGLMGYGLKIPAHRLGGPKNLWDIRGYGLSKAWVMRGSTVMILIFIILMSHWARLGLLYTLHFGGQLRPTMNRLIPTQIHASSSVQCRLQLVMALTCASSALFGKGSISHDIHLMAVVKRQFGARGRVDVYNDLSTTKDTSPPMISPP